MKISPQDALNTATKLLGGPDSLLSEVTQGGGINGTRLVEIAKQVEARLGGGVETGQVALEAILALIETRGRAAVGSGLVARGDPGAAVGQRSVGRSALFAVRGGSALGGIDSSELNLRPLSLPKEIVAIADQTFGNREVRLATAGYSAPPDGTRYEENATAFLGGLADKLGLGNVGFITSPTADQGSIDATTTMLGQNLGVPVLSITAKDYVGYIDPSKFPPDMDKAAYASAPKHVFGDKAKYNQATALASTAFVGVGGRDVTVFDFMRALEKGNPVVLMVDDSMRAAMGDKAVYDADKKRPNNGSAYLAEQITSFLKTGELAHPDVGAQGMGTLNKEWMDDHRLLLEKLVKVVHTDGTAASMDAATTEAAAHIDGFINPSAAEALKGFHAVSVDDIKGRVQESYLASAYQYTALTTAQLGEQAQGVPGGAAHIGEAKRLLDELVHKTARHFGAGTYGMLDDDAMNKASIKQHAGYIAGELRKLGVPEEAARDILVPFYEATKKEGASPGARAKLASDLQVAAVDGMAAPISGREIADEMEAIKNFVTNDDNGWMFNQYGFGPTDQALNRPGVYAGEAVLDFATRIAGEEGAAALLERTLGRQPSELAAALANPKTTEDLVVAFSARAAQAGWLVSKVGQGIVEANDANPKKAEKGLSRVGPKNDLITDFDSLAAEKGWPEVAKDLNQVRTALQASGVLR